MLSRFSLERYQQLTYIYPSARLLDVLPNLRVTGSNPVGITSFRYIGFLGVLRAVMARLCAASLTRRRICVLRAVEGRAFEAFGGEVRAGLVHFDGVADGDDRQEHQRQHQTGK